MNFNQHLEIPNDAHAFLSPSKYTWLKYDEEKLAETYRNYTAAQRGTILHDFASKAINLGQRLQKSNKSLNAFVNDSIGYKMNSEQKLYYSENCFGKADAISFRNHSLRIHDLKTGTVPAHMEQLEIYAALFCLEYGYKPTEIDMELRLYQNDEILYLEPTVEDIAPVMDKIITSDKIIKQIKAEEG